MDVQIDLAGDVVYVGSTDYPLILAIDGAGNFLYAKFPSDSLNNLLRHPLHSLVWIPSMQQLVGVFDSIEISCQSNYLVSFSGTQAGTPFVPLAKLFMNPDSINSNVQPHRTLSLY
jgi:hypothetical protein